MKYTFLILLAAVLLQGCVHARHIVIDNKVYECKETD